MIPDKIDHIRHSFASWALLNKLLLCMIICMVLTVSFPLLPYLSNHSSHISYSSLLADAISKLGINETLLLTSFSNISVSLEGDDDCNLKSTSRCSVTGKSLVVSFWRENSRDKWLIKNFLKVFTDEHFTRVIMIHDNSSWTSYPNRDAFIWIHVNAQKRFWYLKRFLTPVIVKSYKYVWILDDDVELLFNPLHYECVITRFNISLSAPGRMKGVASHSITRVDNSYIAHIGRWTDFVEIGPIVVASAFAWECIWHCLSSFVGLGWGLDLVWCRLMAHRCLTNSTMERACAVLDSFHVNHLSDYIGSTAAGSQEVPAYNQFYGSFHTKGINFAPLAKDLTMSIACNKTQ